MLRYIEVEVEANAGGEVVPVEILLAVDIVMSPACTQEGFDRERAALAGISAEEVEEVDGAV